MRRHIKKALKFKYIWPLLLLIGIALGFSSWLMTHTFSFDKATSSIMIASRAWSDFGAHIPMIRSFSKGQNWPPQYPIFPGDGMRYHFLFYFLVGMLERSGVRIDIALNSLSIAGMSLLIMMIGSISYVLFKDKRVSALSLLFFFFNSSLGFIQFFKEHPLSYSTLYEITHADRFPAFAPWGPGDVSAFWNFNIYTNQRHLGLGVGLGLLVLFFALVNRKLPQKYMVLLAICSGLIVGSFPYLHQPMFIIVGLFLAFYFITIPTMRRFCLIAGTIGLLLFGLQYPTLSRQSQAITFQTGYLLSGQLQNLTPLDQVMRFLQYWLYNIGPHIIFIPLGFILIKREQKKLFFPLFLLFIIPNLFKFSVEMAASHKFFNVFLIIGNMLSAYALIWFVKLAEKKQFPLYRISAYLGLTGILVLMTLSGIIDMFVIQNDRYITLTDLPTNETAQWIYQHTPADSIIVTENYLFNPASIAGRKIFLGWPYFPWSAGYDTGTRMREHATFYETDDLPTFCNLAKKHNISYITYEIPASIEQASPHEDLLKEYFPLRYQNKAKTFRLYEIPPICRSV